MAVQCDPNTGVDLQKLFEEALAVDTDQIDMLATNMLCSKLLTDKYLIPQCVEYMKQKLETGTTLVLTRTISILEECMQHCGTEFKTKVARNSFLNKLSELVSPKYRGNQTDPIVKKKILDMLLCWTIQFPEIGKVHEAYNNLLKNHGVVHENTTQISFMQPLCHVERKRKNNDEEEKLKKLLQSKNPQDIKAANVLIQRIVQNDEKKSEFMRQKRNEIERAERAAKLLLEMISSANTSNNITEDELLCMKELFDLCVNSLPRLQYLSESTSDNDDYLENCLSCNDLLCESIEKYKENIRDKQVKTNKNLINNSTETEEPTQNSVVNKNSLQELSEVFSTFNEINLEPLNPTTDLIKVASDSQFSTNHNSGFVDDILMIPTVSAVFEPQQYLEPTKSVTIIPPKEEKPKINFCDIDSLVVDLKTTLLTQDVVNTESISNHLEKVESMLIEESIKSRVDEDVLQSTGESNESNRKIPLSLIKLDLDLSTPSDCHEPIIIMNKADGLKITFTLAAGQPSEDVNIVVITVINQGRSAITNYHFDASISKPCKLRILQPSTLELPGVKPFKIPTCDITQAMLIYNPTKQPVDLLGILTYCAENDPDEIKELIEIKGIGYVNV